MNLSWKNSYIRKPASSFLSPTLRTEIKRSSNKIKRADLSLSKDDSHKSLISHPRISNNFNSSMLKMNLRSNSYKKAESELLNILRKQKSSKIRLNRVVESLSKSIRLKKGSAYRRTDSSLSPAEAELIIDEYRSVSKPKVWSSILSNYKANPRRLMNLIPISLDQKKSYSSKSVKKSSLSPNRHKKLPVAIGSFINSPKIQYSKTLNKVTPVEVETLKDKSENITDDWAKSLLYYNILNGVNETNSVRLSKNDLKMLMKKLPEHDIEALHVSCLATLEILLMELLGTHQDFARFQSAYNSVVPSVLRTLISNCLKLYKLREMTALIISMIISRENILENLHDASKEDIIEIFKLSKAIRHKIKLWLATESVPFATFVFKGKDYLQKMTEDLPTLQTAL